MIEPKKKIKLPLILTRKISALLFSSLLAICFFPETEGAKDVKAKARPHPPLVSPEVTKCITCHDDLAQGKYVHLPVKGENCDSCHEMRKEADKTLVSFKASGNDLCLSCHSEIEDLLARKNVHPPMEEGCNQCHSPHASDQPGLLISSREEVCSSCHDMQEEAFKNRHGRQPVVPAGCDLCHNPHGSDEEKLFVGKFKHLPFQEGECDACHKRPRGARVRLRGKGGVLCYSCHGDKEKEFAKEAIHTPVKRGECSQCHSPHLSDHKFQLMEEGNRLCLSCHDKIAELLKNDYIHPPAEESCLDCHSAHAADNVFNLHEKVPVACLNCHDAEEGIFKRSHYNQKGESLNCAECHNPHGSDNMTLMNTFSHPPFMEKDCGSCHLNTEDDIKIELVESGKNELCYTCHDDKKIDSNRDMLFEHEAIEIGGCTSCHSAHASAWPHQLRDHTSRLCLSCHDDRKKEREGGKFIHAVIDTVGCEACHDSHFTKNEKFLVEKPNKLCLECHLQGKMEKSSGKEVTILGKIRLKDSDLASFKKIALSSDLTRGHPQLRHVVSGIISPELAKKKRIKDLTFTGEITCLSCHDSHAGASPSLFADGLVGRSQVCLKCHKK